jgi:hypothetical protein
MQYDTANGELRVEYKWRPQAPVKSLPILLSPTQLNYFKKRLGYRINLYCCVGFPLQGKDFVFILNIQNAIQKHQQSLMELPVLSIDDFAYWILHSGDEFYDVTTTFRDFL